MVELSYVHLLFDIPASTSLSALVSSRVDNRLVRVSSPLFILYSTHVFIPPSTVSGGVDVVGEGDYDGCR